MKNAKTVCSRKGQVAQIPKKAVAKAGSNYLAPTSKLQSERDLGLMQGRASYVIHDDYETSDQEILGA